MNRVATVLGVASLIAVLTVPAFARGRGWGGAGTGWGNSANCGPYNRGYGNAEQGRYGAGTPSDQKFFDGTAELRNQIRNRSAELNALMNSAEPDAEKARTLQKELSELQAQMDQKRLEYGIKTRDRSRGTNNGGGYGMGYGDGSRRLQGRGYGPGMMGNGPQGNW